MTKIKSEKAIEILAAGRIGGCVVHLTDAKNAVEITESDAKERATKAYIKCCQEMFPPERGYTLKREYLREQFLKHYDNEK